MTPRIRTSLTLALVTVVSSTFPFAYPQIPPYAIIPVPLYIAPIPSHGLNSSYIVMFQDDILPSTFSLHMDYLAYASKMHPLQEDGVEGGIGHVYDSIVARGYAGRFSEGVIDMIRRRPEVKYVEQDQIVRLQSVQMDPPWGLARINHRNKLHSNNMHYVSETGKSGALAYVLDTGINEKHSDFHRRAGWGGTYFPDEGFVDKDGHGTHVAGIIGSTTYGVAKNTIIRAVKVISPKTTGYYSNADTDYSTVIAGVQWAVEDAMEYAMTHPHAFKGAVINMSLGGGRSRAMDYASNNAVRAGMHVVVAAGNDNRDACEESPAGAELVITVGASTIDDRKAKFRTGDLASMSSHLGRE